MSDNNTQTILHKAFSLHRAGKWKEADSLYQRALQLDPSSAVAYHLWALLDLDLDHRESAISKLEQSIRLNPCVPEVHFTLGEAYLEMGNGQLAEKSLANSLKINPNAPDALWGMGRAFELQGNLERAIHWYEKCLLVDPEHQDASLGLALALHDSGQALRALQQFESLSLRAPQDVELRYMLAFACEQAGRHQEALSHYEEVVKMQPSHVDARLNQSRLLMDFGRDREAELLLEVLLGENPDFTHAHFNSAKVKTKLGKKAQALHHYRELIRLEGGSAAVWNNVGLIHLEDKEHSKAIHAFEEALKVDPDCVEAIRNLFQCRREACDWTDYSTRWETFRKEVLDRVQTGTPAPVAPFYALGLPFTEEECASIAKNYSKNFHIKNPIGYFPSQLVEPERLKIGYVSANFHNHPGNHLSCGIFELHKRDRFEIYAYSFGGADTSRYRQRVVEGVDHFVDITGMSTLQAAQRIREDGIHILLDMKGYTMPHRPEIFAHKPAPVIAGFLGYAGSTQLPSHNFILCDRIIVPQENQKHYSERVIYLPQTYQPNDHKQRLSKVRPSRKEHNLPDDAFVFCCFNQNYKIDPDTFELWMRIMKSVPDSVLWLVQYAEEVEKNLRKEAEKRGVFGERLVFAKRVSREEHLSRHRLADLFLDSYHYNAHTTASDSLFAGVPVLTLAGNTFASRVAKSLVHAAGLGGFAVSSFEAYVEKAIQLATQREELEEAKRYLELSILESPLFDTPRFVEGLESAFEAMWSEVQTPLQALKNTVQ